MGKNRPHTIALGVVRRRDGCILVSEASDPATGKQFYRPVGGHIEFGELAAASLVREFREELGVEIVSPRFLAAIESIYTYDDKPGHEVVLVFEVWLADPDLMERKAFPRVDDKKVDRAATWQPLSSFMSGDALLYPTGTLEILTEERTIHMAADTR